MTRDRHILRRLLPVLLIAALATTALVTTARSPGRAGTRANAATHARQSTAAWPPLDGAATFFLRELRQKIQGDWHAAWRTLYPLHQDVASEREFVACERVLPFPAPLKEVHIVAVRKTLVSVPGLPRAVPGVAVEILVELNWYRDPIVFRHTFHLIPVQGEWKWLLSPSRYKLYRQGGCIPALTA